ncbi:MAG: hypothetical protein HC913_06375 [Microscillaceae bacterium]|nr:hypothetical protein [Microscillaceae bacterium]
MSLFSFRKKSSQPKVYWVIEESTLPQGFALVRYYNDRNEVVFEEKIEGLSGDVIDEEMMQKLHETKRFVIRKVLV